MQVREHFTQKYIQFVIVQMLIYKKCKCIEMLSELIVKKRTNVQLDCKYKHQSHWVVVKTPKQIKVNCRCVLILTKGCSNGLRMYTFSSMLATSVMCLASMQRCSVLVKLNALHSDIPRHNLEHARSLIVCFSRNTWSKVEL